MLILLLACDGPDDSTPTQDFVGSASMLVQRGELSDEQVTMSNVGLSSFDDDGYFVVTAASDDDVYELMLVVDGRPDEPGELRSFRYRKGKQYVLLPEDGSCTVGLSEDGAPSQPWVVSLDCQGLMPEDAQEGDATWSIVEGLIEGGTLSNYPTRGELLNAQGYAWAVELVRQDGGGQRWGLTDSEQVVLVPWRSDSWWLLVDDGVDGQPDDAVIRVQPDTGSVALERFARTSAAEDTDIELALLGDTELTATLDGLDHTGSELTLTIWYGFQEGEDEREVVLK